MNITPYALEAKDLCAVATTANIGDIMNEENAKNIDKRARETMNKFELSRKSPKVKTIVVHPELYQELVLEKGMLTMKWADLNQRPEGAASTPTFADVIVENINRANGFAELMSRIIRLHPEVKSIIEAVSKQDPKHYKLVEGILSTIGKDESVKRIRKRGSISHRKRSSRKGLRISKKTRKQMAILKD